MEFINRRDAGQKLGLKLLQCNREASGNSSTVVLGLPRGGVPVGYEVAKLLNLPLDVFVVRKLGFPGKEELALGAIASGGTIVLHPELINYVSPTNLESILEKEKIELQRREELFRRGRPPLSLEGRNIILVDDGLATGSTMLAAVKAIKTFSPASIVVAVPITAITTAELFLNLVDKFVCVYMPQNMFSVGSFYEDFTQTSDREVINLLAKSAEKRAA